METFIITYHISVSEQEQIDKKIEGICIEQSVEMPIQVVPDPIKEKVVGKLVNREQLDDRTWEVTIAWPVKNLGEEIAHFLNILYGNISLQNGIRIIDTEWPVLNDHLFQGPSFGIEGIRKKYDIQNRALSSTALKPLGSSLQEIGDLCYRFAKGGIDIIKDDQGLANQEYAPYEERVRTCVDAIQKAADETGRRSYYYAHITALAEESVKRYEKAAELGADGVLLCPHIAGLETMHQLARMDIPLPIMAHPAFSGSLITHKNQGLSMDFLYGQLWRALGADFVIYTNVGGRFSFTLQECESINRAARNPDSPFRRSFPTPGGGIQKENLKKWVETYGPDTVFLVGGSLYEHPDGIEVASQEFRNVLES